MTGDGVTMHHSGTLGSSRTEARGGAPGPLPLQIANQPIKLAEQQIASWEKLYGGVAETLELVGGAGRVWTNEEKMAGMANGRQLTQGGPPPQTVYRVARRTGAPLLVTVPLRYAR